MKISETVAAMVPRRYTISQAAKFVGRDVDTLKRWKRNGTYHASDSKQFGKLTVDLYTDDDLLEMRKIAGTMRPGRKAS